MRFVCHAATVAVAVGLAGCSPQPQPRMIAPDTFAMLVPPGSDPASFKVLAKDACGSRPMCKVLIWDDEAKAARALPMTDPEIAALLFSYTVNRPTGFEQSLWTCSKYPKHKLNDCGAEG